MRVLVVIPTTAGPLILRKITPRSELPASCAFSDGDYRPLPWSNDYARLVGPHGPLAKLIPPLAKTAYELRLSASFDAGRSWETPVALAHLAIASGDTLTDDPAQAERILWATGAVDLDLAVITGDYALREKLSKSRAVFDSAPQAALDIRLPPGGSVDEALAQARTLGDGRNADVRVVTTLLDRPPERANAPAERTSDPPKSKPTSMPALSLAAIAVFAAAGAGAWHLLQPPAPILGIAAPPTPSEPAKEPAQPNPPPQPPTLIIEELRAAPPATCRQLLFGAGKEIATVVTQTDGQFRPTRIDASLCGLRFKLAQPGKASFRLPPELSAVTVPGPGADQAGTQTVFLRDNIKQNFVYAVQVMNEDGSASAARPARHELRIAGP